jgi:hypothetical protein
VVEAEHFILSEQVLNPHTLLILSYSLSSAVIVSHPISHSIQYLILYFKHYYVKCVNIINLLFHAIDDCGQPYRRINLHANPTPANRAALPAPIIFYF